ncbi:hypothetical protein N5P18_00320 [Janibacter terrae]|uniref:Uncharacterized protein n=1 Tax=Janibacter terrae TaxID=103817 RepID=A0ABZ2FDF4_9MICO
MAGEYYLGYWEAGGTWAITDAVDVVLEEATSREEALEALQRIDGASSQSWQSLTCSVTIPRESAAKRLELSVQFLVAPLTSKAHGPGARVLLGPTKSLHLEGDGARFPTEPVSFSAMGWTSALWKVKLSYDTPEDAFAGAVRLFVNVDHPGSSALLDPQSAGGQVTRAFLRQDIVRVVLSSLAREARSSGVIAVPHDEDQGESVVGVANAMARDWLRLDIDEAIHLWERSPEEFDSQLQATALDLQKNAFA